MLLAWGCQMYHADLFLCQFNYFCVLPSPKVRLIEHGIKLPPYNVTAFQDVWVFSSDGGGITGQQPKQDPHVHKPKGMLDCHLSSPSL